MKTYIILLITLVLISCKDEKKVKKEIVEINKVSEFYVGTYTDKDSKGIYKYSLGSNGILTKIGLAAVSENPSFLALSPDKKYVLAVNEVNKDNVGFVESFEIENDSLKLINKSSSGGANPCHIIINTNGYVLTSNYSGGNVGLLKLDTNGKISNILNVQQHLGKGTTERQEAPHAHSAWFDKDDANKVIAIDLGTNELWFSEINTETNKLINNKPSKLAMAEGAGPRHLVFHPNKKIIYVLNELDNTITTVLKSENQEYSKKTTVSILPDNFTGFSKAADIRISNDGNFVYASNRGHNSIAILKVDSNDYSLSLVGLESTKGENPRNFSLSPDNKYLIVANQDTNNLVSFKRDVKTGLLTFKSEIKAPTPVCILFNE
ncbi:lactonase family protein [Cellulophaga sp. HaHaR_3_176]|uniref:lactonase family protein n=1 Tax=Cellulophaga sp. HaHaR_3_176 TaxID=1942464 RepID=UPI001C1F33D2|nr:lactonase family protein [Cellulophaga sp. HaHaR_3_176]QWX82701.1 lactonase family protein [Cellulophaga sp. HaHaR_3_176]